MRETDAGQKLGSLRSRGRGTAYVGAPAPGSDSSRSWEAKGEKRKGEGRDCDGGEARPGVKHLLASNSSRRWAASPPGFYPGWKVPGPGVPSHNPGLGWLAAPGTRFQTDNVAGSRLQAAGA